ncbi:MAG TPA: class I SAM-dependent methyltransferase [Terriglobales bacterium]|nr:class I SAM-dependent methyltransferase [Terriglobales bacterium]
MNSVLKEILETGQVSDGKETLPLTSFMDAREGDLLSEVVRFVRPATSLEVGFAYGVSTMFVCDALAKIGKPARHIVIDPFQFSEWRGVGLRNIERAGYGKFVELREARSEIALPQLLEENTLLDMAVIDGWHTFDHALVDFFYVNKMLRVGGVAVLDDSSMPSIGKLVDHALTYGCYRIFGIPSGPGLFARRLAYYARLKSSKWPSALALEKIAQDDRPWNWHRPF